MCEVLVRVVDQVDPGDFYKNCHLSKAGDIVVACPDGWPWSKIEQSRPDWRIIRLPNISLAAVAPFLEPEVDTNPQHPSRTLQARAFRLDYSALTSDLKEGDLATVMVRRPPIEDPAIFGDTSKPPSLIG